MKTILQFGFFCTIILIWCSCSVNSNTSDAGIVGLYDFEGSYLHPEFLVYHLNDTESEVHYKIDASEILFARPTTSEPFRSNVELDYSVYTIKDDSTVTLTSGIAEALQNFDSSENDGMLLGKFSIKFPSGGMAKLKVKVRDRNRSTSTTVELSIDKRSIYCRQNFLPLNGDGIPIFGYQVLGSSEAIIRCDRCTDSDVKIYRNNEEIKLPPPPFSDSRLEMPRHSDGLNMSLPLKGQQLEMNLTQGFYFITQSEDEQEGLTLTVQDSFFPEVASYAVMAESLRFITSRTEYENITVGHNERQKIEEFWIECGGGKDHARELIRTYYRRIQEANLYFSHIAPGWKTDRGLIHIVFGNPKKIYKSASKGSWNNPETEVWLYGEEDNINSLTFTFRKVDSPYTDKHFVLNRDHVYKSDWERAVTSWRNGRIYTE